MIHNIYRRSATVATVSVQRSAAVTIMAVPLKAPANFRNFVRILAFISVLRSIDLPFLLEQSQGKTILYITNLAILELPNEPFTGLLYDTRQMATPLSTPCS